MPYFLATCAVESWLPPTSEVISTSGMRLSASRCFWPNAPCPATQIFIVDLLLSNPSCPALAVRRTASLRSPMCRASTSCDSPAKDVDGRDKPGHDVDVLAGY